MAKNTNAPNDGALKKAADHKAPARQEMHVESLGEWFRKVLDAHGLKDLHVSQFALTPTPAGGLGGHYEWKCDGAGNCGWVWVP